MYPLRSFKSLDSDPIPLSGAYDEYWCSNVRILNL